MISYISGTLAEKNEDSAVVEAHGVGYQIFVPVPVLSELPPLGESVKIYTYFSVREDGMSLFGFLSRQDLAMFKQLIGVNGIGPKSALGILSALRPDVLRMAVASGDAKTISRAPGVGPKTAQRIILDLKDKVDLDEVIAGFSETGTAAGSGSVREISGLAAAAKEAAEALTALGYTAAEASRAVKQVEVTEGMNAEDVLKASLKFLTFL